MTARPSEAELFAALEASWPPEQAVDRAGCRLRLAPGAGSRVNSARLLAPLEGAALDEAIEAVERFYASHKLNPMLQLGQAASEQAAAARAAERGFTEFDPCLLGVAEIGAVAAAGKSAAKTLRVAAPLAALEQLWADGDGGPERRAVMARAEGPSAVFAARVGDRIAGAVFVAVADGICFEHALHCAPDARRQGVGRALMGEAARFGQGAGARWMAVSVRCGNAPARALFEGLGFASAGGYAYWRRDG